jgi:hypothetical protein
VLMCGGTLLEDGQSRREMPSVSGSGKRPTAVGADKLHLGAILIRDPLVEPVRQADHRALVAFLLPGNYANRTALRAKYGGPISL